MRIVLLALIGFLCTPLLTIAQSEGGMWLPHLLKQLNEEEMQSMGMEMTAEDIYSINQSSLKDAIVHFGGFCTGEIISSKGLVLTNHHCGYGQIQYHSSLENNYLEEGFWAMSQEEELPNPDLFVKFIEKIDDVTQMVLAGTDSLSTLEERQSLIDQNIDAIKSSYELDAFQAVEVKAFYQWNMYLAFTTVTYPDVRLVGAPPSSIGKFGADTDNWVWPRHTGDFALFRVYASPDNKPAAYSEENIPYTPKHHLPISLSGVEKGDFTLVFGFPGRTNEYLPASAIKQIAKIVDPARVNMRDEALKVMDRYMKSDPEIKIQYASKFASIANYWKKWIGEMQGLEKSNAIGKKLDFEREFTNRLSQNKELQKTYGDLLPEMNRVYQLLEPYAQTNAYYSELMGRNITMLRSCSILQRLEGIYSASGQAEYDNFKGRVLNYLEGQYKDYSPEVDREVFAALIRLYFDEVNTAHLPEQMMMDLGKSSERTQEMATRLYSNSKITTFEGLREVLNLPAEEAIKALGNDPIMQVYKKISKSYEDKVAPYQKKYTNTLNDLQRQYMTAQMEVFPEKRFYPDANSSLRVTYGNVQGYEPKDAVQYHYQTYLDGVMEKYVPGDYEFDLPKKLLQLYKTKDFGPYAAENGKMPVNFIASNHTTGGNSGSPAIDARGNLIGLNFDRAWEGTMSDLNYDERICRNIMVDARYILFIIDKYAGAEHLIKEMTFARKVD